MCGCVHSIVPLTLYFPFLSAVVASSIYNALVTARILLSWFPQAQGISALQPLFLVTDPFLNLFRGLGLQVFLVFSQFLSCSLI